MNSKRWTQRTWILIVAASAVAPGCMGMGLDPAKAYIDAKTVLLQAAQDPQDEDARQAAMHAIGEVLGEEGGGVLKQALEDPQERVRFAAAMAVGDVQYAPALPVLLAKARMYTGEADKRVYSAILYALHRLGDDSRLGDLAELLFDPDEDVRAFAAQVMGKVGNPAGVPLLKKALSDEKKEKPRYNITEALALLGDEGARARLESFARGYYVDLQLEAIPALGREYSPDTMEILRDLTTERYSPRVRVRSAGAMARLGQATPEGYDLCVRAARDPSRFAIEHVPSDRKATGIEVASLRQLAAISLGWMNRKDALGVLEPLLQDPDGNVRVAAAMSIVRLTGPQRPPAPSPRPAPLAASQPAIAPQPPSLRSSGAKD